MILGPTFVLAQVNAPSRNTVVSLAVMPRKPQNVLVGVLNAPQPPTIYRSGDGGAAWAAAESGLSDNISIAGIAFDPKKPQVVLAGDGGFGLLFRSEDGGKTWTELTSAANLISSNSAIGELYSVIQDKQTVFYACTRWDGVLRSRDAGASWTKLSTGLGGDASRVREVVVRDGTVYAGTHAGLYRLPPGATAWEFVPGAPSGTIIFSLTLHQDQIYLGSFDGIYSSSDGSTWTKVQGFPNTRVYDMLSTKYNLVAATENGVWSGNGSVWNQATANGAPYGGATYAIGNTERAPRIVYAGTVENWVLRSDDEGRTFSLLGEIQKLDLKQAFATATPTPSPTPLPTDTPTPTETPTETPFPTDTPTATPTPTEIPTDTPTPEPLPTDTPIPGAAENNGSTGEDTGEGDSEGDGTGGDNTDGDNADGNDGEITVALDLPEADPVEDNVSDNGEGNNAGNVVEDGAASSPDANSSEDTIVVNVPAPPTNTPLPTDTPLPTGTPQPTETPLPTITPTPTPTSTPIDVVAEVRERLPGIFVAMSMLFSLMILWAGWSVIRGPRDI